MNMDFDPGMNVIVHAPPIAERANFSGTWVEQMINFDGQVGVILPNEPVMNEDGIAHFKVKFNQGWSYWWDVRYMEPERSEDITDEEFDSIFD